MAMKSTVIKRSIICADHQTSVTLEDAFWNAFKEIAAERDMNLGQVVAMIDATRTHSNLSSAIRLFVLDYYVQRLARKEEISTSRSAYSGTDQGARIAGH